MRAVLASDRDQQITGIRGPCSVPAVTEIRVDCVQSPAAALGTGGNFMNWHQKFSVLLFAGLAGLSGHAQTTGKYLAQRDQLVAIRAGRLFDARSGTMLPNQVMIVRSD